MADLWAQFKDAASDPWSQFQDAPAPGKPAAKPAPKLSLGDEVAGAFGGAVDRLKTDVAGSYRTQQARAGRAPPNVFQALSEGASDLGNTAATVGDAIRVVADPISAAIHHTVVEPAAGALSKIPMQAYGPPTLSGRGAPLSPDQTKATWENAINEGLSAVRPGKPGAPVPPAAPKPNIFADKVASFEQAGVRPSYAAVKGNGEARVANAIAENPVAGFRARPAMAAQAKDVAASADRIGNVYGSATTRGAAGDAVQQGVQDFNNRFSTRASALYDRAFAPIDQAEASAVARQGNQPVVTPTATTATLKGIAGRVNAPGLSEIITNPRLQQIAQSLSTDANQVRFGDLRELRTWVRNAQKDPELRQGISQAELSQVESALTTDIYANAESLAGPQAARNLRRADQFYRLGSQRISGALQNFVGRGTPKSGESTYDMILRAASDRGGADAGRLLALKKSLQPHEWGDVAASTIDRMGKATPGAATDPGDFSVSSFVTNYNTLSTEGRNLLFGTGPTRAELDNLAKVAGMVKTVQRGANASNTGISMQSLGTAGALLNPGTMIPAAKILGGLALTGEAMTNPAVVRWLAKVSAARSPAMLTATVKQLSLAAKSNAALLPLSQQTTLLLAAPQVATRAAATPEQPQGR